MYQPQTLFMLKKELVYESVPWIWGIFDFRSIRVILYNLFHKIKISICYNETYVEITSATLASILTYTIELLG